MLASGGTGGGRSGGVGGFRRRGRRGKKERNIFPREGEKLEGRVIKKRRSDHTEPSFPEQIAIKMESCEGVVIPFFFEWGEERIS